MATVREAIYWNLVSAPVRLGLGVAQTALLARSLYGDDGSPLAAFALLSSGIVTAVLFTSFGGPQMFSKIAANRLGSGRSENLGAFSAATAIIRTIAWLILGLLLICAVWFYPDVVPAVLRTTLKDPILFTQFMLWGLSYDLAGLSGRLLSASFEQKWQNVVNVVSQAIGIAIISGGIVVTSHSLHFALAGMAGIYLLRVVGHGLVIRRVVITFRRSALKNGFTIWRSELGQLGHVSLDKLAAYTLSPHFYLLLAGYVLAPTALASLFLLFDFSAKLLTVLAIPVAGVVMPAIGQANAKGEARLAQTMRTGWAAIRVSGFFASLAVAAVAVPFGQILYGRPFGWEPALVCLVLGVIISEFMVLELTGAYLMVKHLAQRLWGIKFVIATAAASAGVVAAMSELAVAYVIAILFGTRLVLLITPLLVSSVERTDWGRGLVLVLGVMLATALGYVYYPAQGSWQLLDLLQASLGAVVLIALTFATLLRSDFLIAMRFLQSPRTS